MRGVFKYCNKVLTRWDRKYKRGYANPWRKVMCKADYYKDPIIIEFYDVHGNLEYMVVAPWRDPYKITQNAVYL